MIVKVVELINASPDEVRPAVLVSATAVGYYGWFLAINLQLYTFVYYINGTYKFFRLIYNCRVSLVLSHCVLRFGETISRVAILEQSPKMFFFFSLFTILCGSKLLRTLLICDYEIMDDFFITSQAA